MAIGSATTVRRNQRVVLLCFTLGLVGIVAFGLWVSDSGSGQPLPRGVVEVVTKDYSPNATSSVDAQDRWVDLSEAELAELRDDNAQLAQAVQQLSDQLEAMRLAQATFNREAERIRAMPTFPENAITLPESTVGGGSPVQQTPPPPQNIVDNYIGKTIKQQTGQNPIPAPPEKKLTVIDMSAPVKDQEASIEKAVTNYLPAGSFVTATLLSGVDAPTGGQADSNPLPVLLRLVDDGQMPNFFRSYVEDCHVTGSTIGYLSSERAHIRLEKLSCILKSGKIIEHNVKGYVTGEDGKAGLRGRVVEKQGALLSRAAAAGFLGGYGDALGNAANVTTVSAAGTETSINPDLIMEAGLAQGGGDAMTRLADYYMKRANDTFPIIEVDAKRIVEIIFTEGVDFGTNIAGHGTDGRM